MKPWLRAILCSALAVASISATCAHAPPAGGDRSPGAPLDPENPEVNCALNNTADCRPAAGP